MDKKNYDNNSIKLKLEHFNILFQYYLKLIDHDQHLRNFFLALNTLVITGISHVFVNMQNHLLSIFLSVIAIFINLFWFRSTYVIKAKTESYEDIFEEIEGDLPLKFFNRHKSHLEKYNKKWYNKYSLFPWFFILIFVIYCIIIIILMSCP